MHLSAITGLLLAIVVAGCSTEGPRRAVENFESGTIGRTPEDAFRDLRGVRCFVKNGENGCMLERRNGCRTWHVVDIGTGRIISWRYESAPEDCWRHSGVG